jgi:hypothetical protein
MDETCWQCGVQPDETYDLYADGHAEPVRWVYEWPIGDHPHAVDPPSPGELTDAAWNVWLRTLDA